MGEQHRTEMMDAKSILGRLDTLTARGIPDAVSLSHEFPDVLAVRRDLSSADNHAASAFLQKQTAEELGLDLRRMAAFHLAIARPLSPGLKMESAEDLSLRDKSNQNSSRSKEGGTSVYDQCKGSETSCKQVSVKVGEVLNCSIDKDFGVTHEKQKPHDVQADVEPGSIQHKKMSYSPGLHVGKELVSPSVDAARTPTLTDSATSPSPPTCLRVPTVYCMSKYRPTEENTDSGSEPNSEHVKIKTSPFHATSEDGTTHDDPSNELHTINDTVEDSKEHLDEADVLPVLQSPCSSDIDV